MKNFINLEKDTSSRVEVLQIKYIEKVSVSMVKVHCLDENQLYIVVLLPKYVGKLLTNELIQNINNSFGYILVISIDYGCNNFLMIHNDGIIFPFSKYNELKIYMSIEGEAIKDHMPLPLNFVCQIHQRKRNKVIKL